MTDTPSTGTPKAGPLELSSAQRRALRAAAHQLKPVVMIGDAGLTPSLVSEADRALAAHGLIKVRVMSDDRAARAVAMDQLCAALHCAAVQQIGKLLVLFRPLPDDDASSRAPSGPYVPKKRAATGASPSTERARRRRGDDRKRPQRPEERPAGARSGKSGKGSDPRGAAPPHSAPARSAPARSGPARPTSPAEGRGGRGGPPAFGARPGRRPSRPSDGPPFGADPAGAGGSGVERRRRPDANSSRSPARPSGLSGGRTQPAGRAPNPSAGPRPPSGARPPAGGRSPSRSGGGTSGARSFARAGTTKPRGPSGGRVSLKPAGAPPADAKRPATAAARGASTPRVGSTPRGAATPRGRSTARGPSPARAKGPRGKR